MSEKEKKITQGVDQIILNWFHEYNRPTTIQSLVDSLGSRVSKPVVQRTLEHLLSNGQLQHKDFKKTRLYFPPQKGYSGGDVVNLSVMENEPPTNNNDDINNTGGGCADDKQPILGQEKESSIAEDNAVENVPISTLEEKLVALEQESQFLTSQITQLRSLGPVSVMQAEMDAINTRISLIEARLIAVTNLQTNAPVEDPRVLAKEAASLISQWQIRKHLCIDIQEQILGTETAAGFGGNPPIETDEINNVSLAHCKDVIKQFIK
eukprot:Tbor_TRINITY_DN2553_c1_g1::TRINITY_DN2553_c1_g1_i1::g.427::m.427/K06695/PSMC3IP; 26S proteasome regulatory subunit, ATPase 3, interacting protein